MTTAPQNPTAAPEDFDRVPDAGVGDDQAVVLTKGGLIRFFAGSAIAAFALSLTFRPWSNVSAFLLMRQDRWLLLVALGLMVLCCLRLPERAHFPLLRLRSWLMVAAALAMITYAGHFLVLSDHDLSRDEQMASFDASVFMKGQIVAPIDAFWRDHSAALNTLSMYQSDHRKAWISGYLPFNSVFRALFGLVGLPYLVGSLMTALGAFALWGCVGRLWPSDRDAKFVALTLYAGSAQTLFAGMTSYAMPDHLALNLCWLWLFLRQTRPADVTAVVVGFTAVGLHQPLMHQMFVAPFIVLLLYQRCWHRAGFYIGAYAVISAFWLYWPTWMISLIQASPDAVGPAGFEYFSRLIASVHNRDPMGLADMVANFLRFIAWQHLLLVPLVIFGVRQYRRNPMIVALASGLVLTAAFMAIALPDQGHGFGYRYFHGLIGNAILLAIYGWKALDDRTDARPGQWRALLVRTTAATVMVLMPIQAVMSHNLYGPAARVSRLIDTIKADYVVVGAKDVPFSQDLVLNPPMVDRRPIGLLREKLDAASIAAICASHPSVAFLGNQELMPIAAYFGFGIPVADRFNPMFAPRLVSAGCNIVAAD